MIAAIIAAVLFGAAISAPTAVLAWEHRPHLARLLAALKRRTRRALGRRPHARALPRLAGSRGYVPRHSTPPGGTAVITAEQIAAATDQKQEALAA